MSTDRLFARHEEVVRPEWIDYSGHMNIGYYLLPFENASSVFCQHVGLSRRYRERTNHALFAAETHVTFEREVKEADRLRFTTQLIAWGPRWINCIHCMHQAEAGYLAATNQVLFVHVNLETRRSAPLPDGQQATLREIMASHAELPIPEQAGRAITKR